MSDTRPRRPPSARALLRTLGHLTAYKWLALGAFVAIVFGAAGNLAVPRLSQLVIDQGIIGGEFGFAIVGGIAIVVVTLVRSVFTFMERRLAARASQGVAFDLRNRLHDHIEQLSFSYHDRAQTGQLLTRATSDVDLVQQFIGMGVLHLVSAVLLLGGALVLLFSTNARLALTFFPVMVAVAVVFTVMARKGRPLFRKAQNRLAELNGRLEENILGVRVVRAFAREPHESALFATQNDRVREINARAGRIFALSIPLVFAVPNFGTVLITWTGALESIAGRLTLGELVAFQSYLLLTLFPVTLLGQIMMSMAQASAGAERIWEILDAESEVRELPGARPLPPIEGRVAFERVSFRYVGGASDVLSEVSFTTEPGQTIALLGATGSGKSSIVALIPRFYDATAGRVTIDGVDIREVTLDSLRRQIGIVLQETTLFGGTVRDNLCYGRPDAGDEEVERAARAAAAHDFITGLPGGYDAVVGERGVTLSGGQRQRIAIARALLIEPRILILDDSTSSVDFATEARIQEALEELRRERLAFVIAQRISTVREADHILLLDDGRLVATGTHQSLVADSPLYVDICSSQLVDDREALPVAAAPAAAAGPGGAVAAGGNGATDGARGADGGGAGQRQGARGNEAGNGRRTRGNDPTAGNDNGRTGGAT